LNRKFSEEEIQMDNKYMKQCLKFLAIGGWGGGEMNQTMYAHVNK
jgi:hypothetical protein